MAVRTDTSIRRVKAGGREHKLSICGRCPPSSSALRFFKTMEAFSEISGYKINLNKSEVMPVSRACLLTINDKLKFKWIDSGMQYLGIHLTPNIKDMV